jgi:hypothetical protein
MRRFLVALAASVVGISPATGAVDEPPAAKPSPRAQFQAALDEYQKASAEFSREYSKARTDAERRKFVEEKYPRPAKYAERFSAIADAAPDDPVAVDALVWCVQLGRGTPIGARGIDRLLARHAENPKVGKVASLLAYEDDPKAVALLRAIAAKNTDREARGNATLALGQWLNRRVEFVQAMKANTLTLDLLHGRGIDAEALRKDDPDALVKQAEAAFEKVAKEYGDVAVGRDTLGKVAERELNAIRFLGVGKPCPEIAGEDLDGKAFKLSDYKGKVVVVDFWGDW